MSELRTAISDLAALCRVLPARHALPAEGERETRRAVEAIANGRELAPGPPPEDRLKRAGEELRRHQQQGRDPAELPATTLRDAVWLLWSPPYHACRIPGVEAAIFELAGRRPRLLARCIGAWLVAFDPADPDIAASGRLIASALAATGAHPRFDRWREVSRMLHLFEPRAGPGALAHRLLGDADLALATRLGFDQPPRASGGYMRAVLGRIASLVPDRLRRPDPRAGLARVEALFVPDGRLRFDEAALRGALADGVVGGWVAGPAPPDALREPVLRLLTTHLGDPRMKPERWSEASEPVRRIVLGWLARATFAAFFDLIGRYAKDDEFAHHWADRRRFWSACLDRGWIADSWLVLGENVGRDAAVSRELRGSYGRLIGSRPNHSALLMRIGSTVFAEWSHNGRLHAWEAGAAETPRFGSPGEYRFGDLTARGLWFPPPSGRPDLRSQGAEGLTHFPGIWQGRVARLLAKRDSLRLEPQDWS